MNSGKINKLHSFGSRHNLKMNKIEGFGSKYNPRKKIQSKIENTKDTKTNLQFS
jgi:hypothetical protein